jgi:lysophospholipase L1-like esterase
VRRGGGRRFTVVVTVMLAGAVGVAGGVQVGAQVGAWAVPLVAVAAAAGAGAERGEHVVGLGDSVLSSQNCGCPGLLQDYADLAAARLNSRVRVRNEARPNAASAAVLARLRDKRVRAAVGAADLVVIYVGANDFRAAFDAVAGGGSPKRRYGRVADRVHRNVAAILEGIHHLNNHARVVLGGYWNDFKDGAVARREYTKARRLAAQQATDYTDDALRSAAITAGAHYLETRQIFHTKGDITPLLAADGDHLSAAGHRVIARELLELLHPSDNTTTPAEPNPTQPTTPEPDPTQPRPAEPPQPQPLLPPLTPPTLPPAPGTPNR